MPRSQGIDTFWNHYLGPFNFANSILYIFTCRIEKPKNLSLILPSGLSFRNPFYRPGNILVVIANYSKVWAQDFPENPHKYHEALILIPCLHIKTGPAFYCSFIYLDEIQPLIAGREIYGFPKKFANITIKELKNNGQVSVKIRERKIMDINWGSAHESNLPEIVKKVLNSSYPMNLFKNTLLKGTRLLGKFLPQAIPLMKIPVINWRRIPAIHATTSKPAWSVNELTVARFKINRIHSIRLLEVKENAVKFYSLPNEPLRNIFGTFTTSSGIRLEMDFNLPPGKVLKQYH